MRDIAQLIAEIAAQHGDTAAVMDRTGAVDYRRFEAWTNDLAARVTATLGAAPRVCMVVAAFDRQAIVGMFAVLKTPHIFLPIDRETPAADIATIARQLGAGAVVYGDSAEAAVRAAGLRQPLIAVGPAPEGPVAPPPPLPDLTRMCLYKRSSGSTGGAKTAAHSVEGIYGDAFQGAEILDITPGARLAIASTFDAALASAATARTILSGATLLPVDLRFEGPKQAAARLVGAGLTHVYCTPTAVRLLCRGLPAGEIFPKLRSVLLGGEKTTMADVRLLSKTTPPGAHLRATFASTETQLVAHTSVPLAGDFGPEDFAEMTLAEGVRIDILDPEGQPLQAGQTGRVRVTSKMITLGYQGHVAPELAAKVRANADGTRSFMTDDMGYLSPEGRIVLTSRAGREVKIRGRRVDLGELEAWLTAQEDIVEAAVVAQPIGNEGSLRLTAFVKGDDGFAGPEALRKRMQAELIPSMLPAAIVPREALARTPNQKIDRRALEADLSHLAEGAGEVLPTDGLTAEIAQIWAEVLGRPVRGPQQDFFDLGGDSIAATLTAVQMEEALGRPIDTGFVYRYPTLSEQVAVLERSPTGVPLPDRLLVPLTVASAEGHGTGQGAGQGAGERPEEVFLISGAGGHVFPFAPVAKELQDRWDLLGILHPGILDGERPLGSIAAYADRVGQAIKARQPVGPYLIVGYSFGAAVAHEIARRLAEAGEQAGAVLIDLQVPRLATLRYKAWYARGWIERFFRRDHDGAETPRFLDEAELDPVERARLSISISAMARLIGSYAPPKSRAPTVVITAADKTEPGEAVDLGWGKVAPLVKVATTPGNHLDMFKGPYTEGFSQLLDECLTLLQDQRGRPGR